MNDKVDRTPSRPQRVPIGTRQRLKAKNRAGYHRRYVNDNGDRVQQFLDAGYTFVSGNEDANDQQVQHPDKMGGAVRVSVGNDTWAYLMEIPLEWYNEDQEAKQKYVDEVEDAIDPTRNKKPGTYGNQFSKVRKPLT